VCGSRKSRIISDKVVERTKTLRRLCACNTACAYIRNSDVDESHSQNACCSYGIPVFLFSSLKNDDNSVRSFNRAPKSRRAASTLRTAAVRVKLVVVETTLIVHHNVSDAAKSIVSRLARNIARHTSPTKKRGATWPPCVVIDREVRERAWCRQNDLAIRSVSSVWLLSDALY